MGVDKATVEVGGRPMIDHVMTALQAVSDQVVVAGRPEPVGGHEAIPDHDQPFRGPLAGLAAARHRHPDGRLVVVAVDQPWVRPVTLQAMIDLGGDLPVVPVEDGVRQTTCAVYPPLDGIEAELDADGSIQSLLDRVSFLPVVESTWREWGEDGRSWFSVDTVADIDDGLDRFGPP